jgi:diaminopimelate epimerase
VLVVAAALSSRARARMIVQNADGSRPEMCGNGLRCVALHLARRDGLAEADYVVETDAGEKRCAVRGSGDSASIVIGMGRAEARGAEHAAIGGVSYAFDKVSVGNPHAISMGASVPSNELVDAVGPRLSGAIPGGTNVEFVAPRGPRSFDLVVWERGVGRTLACGTGAAATAAALAFAGKAPFDAPIEIHLPGGALELWVASGTHEVTLRGPARWVFDGTTTPAEGAR